MAPDTEDAAPVHQRALTEMAGLMRALDAVIAEAKAARKRLWNNPDEYNVTSTLDDAVTLLEHVKTRLEDDISAGGDRLP
jgi:hypothetical protein